MLEAPNQETKQHLMAATAAKSLQSCLTLSDPMNCSLPGFSVHGIFQARVLEWGAMPSPYLTAGAANTNAHRARQATSIPV